MGRVYLVYMLTNARRTVVYTGVTGNPAGRMWQHKHKVFRGSFTARYNADRLVWYEVHEDPEQAILREKRIKDWKRAWKDRLIEEMNPEWKDLGPEVMGWFDGVR